MAFPNAVGVANASESFRQLPANFERADGSAITTAVEREAIITAGIKDVIYGRNPKGPGACTFEQQFETVFGEPPISKPHEKSTSKGGYMTILTIGIDPGLTGGLAVLSPDGAAEFVADLPVIRDRTLAWIDGNALRSMLIAAKQGRPWRVIVERVSAMPKQGVSSSFQFGVGFGSVLGVLQALQLPIEFVTAAVWKRALGLSSDKRASLHKARLLYPTAELHLAKHDGRAEALLLCHWALTRDKSVAA
jgi:crossover junction endodeoxyribonuclease RuvC